jgi:hypothetical protein
MLQKIAQRLLLAAKVFRYGPPAAVVPREPVPPISPEEIAEAKAFFPLEKFFVFGHARSGTTLLMRLLDAHPEIHCSRQAHFFTRPPFLEGLVKDPAVAEWLSRGSVRWNRGRDLSPVFMRAAADFILERDARQQGASIVGDKSPNSINDGESVRLMHAVYPDARLVYIVRDGRDAVLSHRFQAFIDATQHLTREDWRIRKAFKTTPDAFHAGGSSLFTPKSIENYARKWLRNVEETSRLGQELFGSRYHELRYEDLLDDPVSQVKAAWGFLGADTAFDGAEDAVLETIGVNRDARWQQEKAGEMAQAIPKGKQGGWEHYFTPRDREVFAGIAGEMLARWGYAVGDEREVQ